MPLPASGLLRCLAPLLITASLAAAPPQAEAPWTLEITNQTRELVSFCLPFALGKHAAGEQHHLLPGDPAYVLDLPAEPLKAASLRLFVEDAEAEIRLVQGQHEDTQSSEHRLGAGRRIKVVRTVFPGIRECHLIVTEAPAEHAAKPVPAGSPPDPKHPAGDRPNQQRRPDAEPQAAGGGQQRGAPPRPGEADLVFLGQGNRPTLRINDRLRAAYLDDLGSCPAESEGTVWLSDDHAQLLATDLGISVAVFQLSNDGSNHIAPPAPGYRVGVPSKAPPDGLILNLGGHWDALRKPKAKEQADFIDLDGNVGYMGLPVPGDGNCLISALHRALTSHGGSTEGQNPTRAELQAYRSRLRALVEAAVKSGKWRQSTLDGALQDQLQTALHGRGGVGTQVLRILHQDPSFQNLRAEIAPKK